MAEPRRIATTTLWPYEKECFSKLLGFKLLLGLHGQFRATYQPSAWKQPVTRYAMKSAIPVVRSYIAPRYDHNSALGDWVATVRF